MLHDIIGGLAVLTVIWAIGAYRCLLHQRSCWQCRH
jgi:hypothetical protein